MNSLSSSSIDLTNDSIVINKSVIKKKLSSIFKTNNIVSDEVNADNQIIQPKYRSLSLKTILPSLPSFNTTKINSKNSLNADIDDDYYLNLNDSDSNGINFNNDNIKLVLNDNEIAKAN